MKQRDTSIAAFHELQTGKHLNRLEQQVVNFLADSSRPASRSMIADGTGLAINSVCGRVNELIKRGILEDAGKMRCSVTGRTVHAVQIKQTKRAA